MPEVDMKVKEGVPHTGVYTSDQGAVLIGDLELARIERAWIRVDNGISVYRETGKRWGTTYAGTPRVVGQITRAFVNEGELKMVLGHSPDVVKPAGPRSLPIAVLWDIFRSLLSGGNTAPQRSGRKNWYPLRADIQINVNVDELPVTSTNPSGGTQVSDGKIQAILAKNCIINGLVMTFDSRGLITSGPIDFLGSSIEWSSGLT